MILIHVIEFSKETYLGYRFETIKLNIISNALILQRVL